MKLKSRISAKDYVCQLSDWELISAYSFCKRLLDPRTFLEREEFEDLCFFMFDCDEQLTRDTLKEIMEMYLEEYSKRHAN